MLLYSIPLIPVQLSAFVLNLSDRLFLQEYSTMDQVGFYTLAYGIASFILLFAVQPLRAFTPYLFSLIDTPTRSKKTLADFTRYYFFGILLITLMISMFSKEAIMVISDKAYHSSWEVVFPITLAFGFYGVVVLSSYAIEIVKKNWISSLFWALGALVNILCNFLLIPRYGIWGASIATVISYFIVLVCYWVAIKVVYPVPYSYRLIFSLLALGTIFYYISTLIHAGMITSIFLKSGLLLVFMIIVVGTGYLSKDEVDRARKWLSALARKLTETKRG
jgi:O-antigen/teichoic acid export membrane protein